MHLSDIWPQPHSQWVTLFQLSKATSLQGSVLVVVLLLFAGCARDVPTKAEQARETAKEYGDLRLTLQTNAPKLQEQLIWVETSKTLPVNLRATMTANAQSDGEEVHDGCEIIRKALKLNSLETLLSETSSMMPGLSFDFSPVELEQARTLLLKYTAASVTARESLANSWNTQWEIEEGYLADLSWADAVSIIARLELLQAAVEIQEGNINPYFPFDPIRYSMEFA
ncbi:MAG: hypothetical protein ACKVH8_13395, partial [Pirellulales bacterium]